MGLSPAMARLSRRSDWLVRTVSGSYNPGRQAFRFRLVRVRSPLLAESRLISVPPGTEMFHFPGCRLRSLLIQLRITPDRRWIAPFGNPRIRGHLHLPVDYRGLSRPSSPARRQGIHHAPEQLAGRIQNRNRQARIQVLLPACRSRLDPQDFLVKSVSPCFTTSLLTSGFQGAVSGLPGN